MSIAFSLALASKILAIVVAQTSLPLLPVNTQFSPLREFGHRFEFGQHYPHWLRVWGNFDGYYYLSIAKRGYYTGEVPFFPLFPLAVRWTKSLTHTHYILAGQLTSFLFLVAGLVTSVKLLSNDRKKSLIPLFLASLLLFPTSYSMTAIYNDSMFYFLATLCLYYARKARWFAAGFAGSLATLTRLNGVALFPYLLAEYLAHMNPKEEWNLRVLANDAKKLLRKKLHAWGDGIGILLVPLTFLVYLGAIHAKFGHYSVLFSAMKVWGQDKMIFPLQTVWRYIKILFLVDPHQIGYWVAVSEIGFLLFYVTVLIWSWKKIRFPYWLFLAVSILLPSLTGTFQGMPRYGLHLYPLFLALSLWLSQKHRLVKIFYFACSIALSIWCVVLFTHGIFIA